MTSTLSSYPEVCKGGSEPSTSGTPVQLIRTTPGASGRCASAYSKVSQSPRNSRSSSGQGYDRNQIAVLESIRIRELVVNALILESDIEAMKEGIPYNDLAVWFVPSGRVVEICLKDPLRAPGQQQVVVPFTTNDKVFLLPTTETTHRNSCAQLLIRTMTSYGRPDLSVARRAFTRRTLELN